MSRPFESTPYTREPSTEEAVVVETCDRVDGHYLGDSVTFQGIRYLPTRNVLTLGTLLFGLGPAVVNFDTNSELAERMTQAKQVAGLLHQHATARKGGLQGEGAVPSVILHQWRASAVALGSDATTRTWLEATLNDVLGINLSQEAVSPLPSSEPTESIESAPAEPHAALAAVNRAPMAQAESPSAAKPFTGVLGHYQCPLCSQVHKAVTQSYADAIGGQWAGEALHRCWKCEAPSVGFAPVQLDHDFQGGALHPVVLADVIEIEARVTSLLPIFFRARLTAVDGLVYDITKQTLGATVSDVHVGQSYLLLAQKGTKRVIAAQLLPKEMSGPIV